MYGAWNALPAPLQRRIEGLRVKHDGTYNSGGYVREGVTPTRRSAPVAGRAASARLHASRNRTTGTLPRAPSQRISSRGCRSPSPTRSSTRSGHCATRDELTWTHHWRVGDLVMWDNRCTMHRRTAFDANSRRVMHRTQIKGDTRPRA